MKFIHAIGVAFVMNLIVLPECGSGSWLTPPKRGYTAKYMCMRTCTHGYQLGVR